MAKILGALGVLIAIGVGGLGILVMSVEAVAAVLGLGAIVGCAVAASRPDQPSRSPRLAFVGIVVAAVVAVSVVVIGLVVLLGAAALALVLVAAAAAAMRARHITEQRRARHRQDDGRGVAPSLRMVAPPAPLPGSFAALSTPDLCRAWRVSYLSLQGADPEELERVALVRACFLDELERRDPAGFRRWIDLGARAAGDPTRFITGGCDARDGEAAA